MEKDVPEEILREILGYTLWPIPLACFLEENEAVFEEDLGGPRKMPPGDVLLVCKRWLRVATPLYYQYIRLSTPQQTQGLASVLRVNPDIGPMIRSARLDGGFGRDLNFIVKHATNLQTLRVQNHVLSKHSNAGLLRALPHLKPTRLYVLVRNHRSNQKSRALLTAIMQSIKSWTALEQLYIFYGHTTPQLQDVLTSIREAQSLKIISLDPSTFLTYVAGYKQWFIDAVANVQSMHVRADEGHEECRVYLQELPTDLQERVVFKTTQNTIRALQHDAEMRAIFEADEPDTSDGDEEL